LRQGVKSYTRIEEELLLKKRGKTPLKQRNRELKKVKVFNENTKEFNTELFGSLLE
jgi:hypothetical protein